MPVSGAICWHKVCVSGLIRAARGGQRGHYLLLLRRHQYSHTACFANLLAPPSLTGEPPASMRATRTMGETTTIASIFFFVACGSPHWVSRVCGATRVILHIISGRSREREKERGEDGRSRRRRRESAEQEMNSRCRHDLKSESHSTAHSVTF